MNLYLYSQVRAVDFGLADDLWEHSQHWEPPQLSTFFHCDMLLAIVALENYVSSNWWLLREGGFLRRKASNRCLFPLCTPKKAYAPLQCFFSTVYSPKSHITPYSAFLHCVITIWLYHDTVAVSFLRSKQQNKALSGGIWLFGEYTEETSSQKLGRCASRRVRSV